MFQVVVGDAGAAEVETTLDFADALRGSTFEEKPVNSPSFASEGVFEFVFLFRVHACSSTALPTLGEAYKTNS